MNTQIIKNNANLMLKHFVDCLGLDGEYYTKVNNSPIIFNDKQFASRFLTAQSQELKSFLNKTKIDDNTKRIILDEGLIIINTDLKNAEEYEIYITLIHEKLHSNRMILLNKQKKVNPDIESIFFDNNKFIQNTHNNSPYYADASQDILLSSIDDSKKEINKYSSLSYKEKDNLAFSTPNYNDKMEAQYKIDEALVETMAIISYQLYKNKSNDIMSIVEDLNKKYKSDDIKALTNIILRHNNLELFKWMLDPLSYQQYDVNYDFFTNYLTKEDLTDLNIIINSYDLSLDELINSSRNI